MEENEFDMELRGRRVLLIKAESAMDMVPPFA